MVKVVLGTLLGAVIHEEFDPGVMTMSDVEISRRERKKGETRQRIFQAAMKLFRERGFMQTTVDDITERADVSKGTFFNYFPRKEAVLGYLSEMRLDEIEAGANGLLAAGKPAREKLIEIYAHAASAYEGDRDLTRFVLSELLSQHFDPVEEPGRRWDDLVARLIAQGQASGEMNAGVDPQRAMGVLTSTYYGLLFMWANCPEIPFDLQSELRARMNLVLDGITTKGGAR